DKDGRVTKAEATEALKKFGGDKPAPSSGDLPAQTQPVTSGPKLIKAGDVGVGRMIADLTFTGLKGAPRQLSDWKENTGVVVAMTSATCPVSKRYAPSLAALEKELRAQNIALLLVNPFASDRAPDIEAQLAAAGLTAPYAHDPAFAAALGARTTTEVFLLDATRTLIYRGALDDQYGANYSLDAPRANYLRDAVAAMLAGQRPHPAATEALGCELDLPEAKNTGTTEVTYHRDVARILQQNCVACHRDQGIAPFPLDDLAEVKDRAKTIKRVISEGTMPPWFAAPMKEGNPWANDCSLGARDKADLLAWLSSSNRPLGDAHDAPAKLVFAGEWSIGQPDYIVQLPQPVAVKADGYMPYQFITAQTTLTEDRWVQAYEILPSDRSVVHHVIVNVHTKGAGKLRDREEGTGGFWAAYVPGNGSQIYPPGFARKLPAGATVSFQIHYTPSGTAVKEQMRMGLVFAKEPPRFAVETLALPKRDLNIPPGDANHVESTERTVPFDLNVMAYMAHMHVRGKAFKYELVNADGTAETLLDIPRYDFNWQIRYDYAQPRLIPRGSKLRVTAIFDNSPGNKANPDPAQRVKWGPQTYEEMMIGYIEHFVPIRRSVAAE
ncbi:MAG: redoxin family protein, partial [Verrucomicrobiota bacterium]|nr:redoxin family protein [Verrucomicrobiota bacterium]